MSMIHTENLHKTYRLGRVDVPVLRGVSMEVRQGEWLAILGASGSGKSTLLHLLGGLDRPDRRNGKGGSILFSGRSLQEMSRSELDRFRATRVGFVFQFYHLLPELTVLENVTIAGMVKDGRLGFKKREAETRAKSLLEAFGLSHRLKHRSAELSGGERQRVAIARALMNSPEVLLADEPTGNLDRSTGEKILDAVASLRAQSNQTIVMVTHDVEVARRADRTIRLEDGHIVPAHA
jgi:lipoprotein-releasing system ATP-binding protein